MMLKYHFVNLINVMQLQVIHYSSQMEQLKVMKKQLLNIVSSMDLEIQKEKQQVQLEQQEQQYIVVLTNLILHIQLSIIIKEHHR